MGARANRRATGTTTDRPGHREPAGEDRKGRIMSWVKVDDRIFLNPKFRAEEATTEARMVYFAGLTFAAQAESDGAILTSDLPLILAYARISDPDAAVAALLNLKLWERTASGYQIHDYLEYQFSRAWLNSERARKRQVAAARRAAEKPPTPSQPEPEQAGDATSGESSAATSAATSAACSEVPSRPVPSPPDPEDLLNNGVHLSKQQCPAGGPAEHGGGGAGEVSPLVLVPTEPDKPKTRKAPKPSKWDPEGFAQFWAAYPKKVKKQNALAAWRRLEKRDLLLDAILAALEWQRKSAQWTEDAGKYIPSPDKYLSGRRWEDEPSAYPPPAARDLRRGRVGAEECIHSAEIGPVPL
jgi:hypothetical protein